MQYPEAETIHLVMDNLNIHRRKSLTDLYGAEMAGSLGPLHRSLHAHARKLAQSGGNRNRHLLAAMSGNAEESPTSRPYAGKPEPGIDE